MRRQLRSAAIDRANNLFKQAPTKVATDYEKAELAFHANRERLKAERLARDAKRRSHPHRTA